MSGIFDLDAEGQASLQEQVQANPTLPENITPGFFQGAAGAIGSGVMRGGARAGEFLGMAAIAPAVLYDKLAGAEGDHTDDMFRALDDYVHSAVDYWTPGPSEVGTAGRILGGLSEIALPLMVSGGNPALMIGSQEMGTAADLVREGATAPAAVGVGLIQGAASAVGFKLPFLGKTLASRMASGAAGNLVVNAGAGAASVGVLDATGNESQAAQFNPANMEARTVDVLTGLAFGALAHASLQPSERAAILTAGNAKHFQSDTAPGEPVTIADSVAHQEAMDAAVHDLLHGDPVVASEEVTQANFAARPETSHEVPAELKDLETPAAPETAAEAPMPVFEPGPPTLEPEEPVHVAVTAARQRLADSDLTIATGDLASDGTPMSISARELMAKADENVARAKTDAKAFEVAVACHMQGGG